MSARALFHPAANIPGVWGLAPSLCCMGQRPEWTGSANAHFCEIRCLSRTVEFHEVPS